MFSRVELFPFIESQWRHPNGMVSVLLVGQLDKLPEVSTRPNFGDVHWILGVPPDVSSSLNHIQGFPDALEGEQDLLDVVVTVSGGNAGPDNTLAVGHAWWHCR